MSEEIELYKKWRPKVFSDLIGQPDVVEVLDTFIKRETTPHAMLFTGPSGCGKTSAARIMRKKLCCIGRDFKEINCASEGGINDIRHLRARLGQSPGPKSECKVYLLDECQRLTPDAQGALLKILEDTHSFVYFILCTTDPQKLRIEIHTRCTPVKFKAVSTKDMKSLLWGVLHMEGSDEGFPEKVADKIVEVADGSPRKALVLLGQVIDIYDDDKKLNIIEKSALKVQGFQIAQALLYGKPWKEVAKLCNETDEEPETIRRIILGYCTKVLLGGGKFASRAYVIIESFRDNWYDCGKAGLAASSFDVYNTKR